MKTLKRNAVVVTVLLFVCAAVYLNWSYDKKTQSAAEIANEAAETGKADDSAVSADAEENSAGLYYSELSSSSSSGDDNVSETGASVYDEYFAKVRLEREQARDDAAASLQTVASSEGASQETIDDALSKMTQMAEWRVKEAELETLINAKGFIDCVVYISNDSVSVTVAAEEGLSTVSVAKITDIILQETDFTADQITITEIKDY